MEAAPALAHLAAGRQQGIGKGADLLLRLAEQMQGQPLGGARPDAGQPLELVDQPGQGSGEAAQRSGAGVGDPGRGGAPPECQQAAGRAQGENGTSSAAAMPAPLRPPLPVRDRPGATAARPRPAPGLRRWSLALCGLVLAVAMVGCSAAAAGLQSFQSPDGRYAFLYPTGWTRVQVPDGPQLVFHDLINSDETLSLVISEVDAGNNLEDLGSAVAVGERLRRGVIAPEGSGREAELVEARERDQNGHTYYDLEYAVHLADRDRHELATVVVDRGRLYTFAASTNEVRWPRVRELFDRVIGSFTLLI